LCDSRKNLYTNEANRRASFNLEGLEVASACNPVRKREGGKKLGSVNGDYYECPGLKSDEICSIHIYKGGGGQPR